MAKKRKQRSSEPAPVETLVPQLQEVQSLPETIQEEDPQNVAIEDDSGGQEQEPQGVEKEEREELEQGREDEEKEPEEEDEEGGEGEGEDKQPEEHHSHNLEVSSSDVAQSNPEIAEANSANEGASNGNEATEEEENEEDDSLEKLLEPFGKDQLVALLRKSVDKHPDLMDSVREIADADPAHRKIFVHGLGWDTTAETLKSEFGKYGEIEDCKAVTDRVSGKSKGYAFILFKQRAGARKALRQPQKKIGNRITSCQLATAGPVPAPPPTTPAVSEYTQRKIFVSNVSAEIDPEKLLEFFRQYGEIEDGPLGLDKQTGKPKGFALFVYKSVESAKKALEEPHKKFDGHTLHCQRAIDGQKSNKTGYGAVHHQHHHHQPHYQHTAKKGKYSSGAHGPGHLMAPSGPSVNFSPGMAPQGLNPALGQALTALGLGNLLGGLGGAPVNMGGPPAGYGNQAGGGYAIEPGMQGGYPNLQMNPHMGQSGAGRAQQGSAPYMGH